MKIGVPKERQPLELRVAISPEIVGQLRRLGFDVIIESGAGLGASFSDEAFRDAGATIGAKLDDVFGPTDVILKVGPPFVGEKIDEISLITSGTLWISNLHALSDISLINLLAKRGTTAFALDLLPRVSRAQAMDILSSQSNLSGYKSVLDAAGELGRALPMMMTPAGTIAPAKVFIMGVGVAGLQAIATAKRLGAVVTATDIRPATKEQVESLGARFLEVDAEMEKDAQTAGGYAKEMPREYLEKQKIVVSEHIKKQDIVITTALIPGRPAPKLLTKDMVATMLPGSVVVDLAVESGGNCEVSELGKIVTLNSVKIIGYRNVGDKPDT